MGASQSSTSTPTRQFIIDLSKRGDYIQLKRCLDDLQRNHRYPKVVLDQTDENGYTPLLLASMKGHYQVVELLLKHGASIHIQHFTVGSALHAALNYNQPHIVDLLLAYKANPFIENTSGKTPMEIAQDKLNIALLRRMETHSIWRGWLHMKTKRMVGLSIEWRRHWVVLCYRFKDPFSPSELQLVHLVLLVYENKQSSRPTSVIWVTGATAQEALNPRALDITRGAQPAQIDIQLHPAYKVKPNGCFVSGSQETGYIVHFRPGDGSREGCAQLEYFASCINVRGSPEIENNNARDGGGCSSIHQAGPSSSIQNRNNTVEQDAIIARRLQEEEDERIARLMARMDTSFSDNNNNGSGSGNTTAAAVQNRAEELSFAQSSTRQPPQSHTNFYPSPVFTDVSVMSESLRPSAPVGIGSVLPNSNTAAASGGGGGGGSSSMGHKYVRSDSSQKPKCMVCLIANAEYGFLHESKLCQCICDGCRPEYMENERKMGRNPGRCLKCQQTFKDCIRVFQS